MASNIPIPPPSVTGAPRRMVFTPFSSAVPNVSQLERKLFHDTNAYRRDHQREPLRYHPHLAVAARVRALDMSMANYLDHKGSDGRPYQETISRYAPTARGVSENIARWTDPQGTKHMWAALNRLILALQLSQAHKANWLIPEYLYLGVGAAAGPGYLYLVQVFAKGV